MTSLVSYLRSRNGRRRAWPPRAGRRSFASQAWRAALGLACGLVVLEWVVEEDVRRLVAAHRAVDVVVTGTVQGVRPVAWPCVERSAGCVRFTLQTGASTLEVVLGPEVRGDATRQTVGRGDVLEVAGSRFDVGGDALLMATRVSAVSRR